MYVGCMGVVQHWVVLVTAAPGRLRKCRVDMLSWIVGHWWVCISLALAYD